MVLACIEKRRRIRRQDGGAGEKVDGMEVPGKRRRGRPNRRWLDSIKNDLSKRELSDEDAQNWAKWRHLKRHIDPHKSGENEEEEEEEELKRLTNN